MTRYVKNVSGVEIQMTPSEIAERQAQEAAFKSEILAKHLSEYRYKKEHGGVDTVFGRILTDIPTRTNLLGARASAVENPNYTVKWKTPNGFVDLTDGQIIAISDLVRDHVQKCFDVEASLTGIEFKTIAELEAAFDAAYAAA